MKSTLSIVAFTLTFGFSVVLVGLLFGFPQPTYDYLSNRKQVAPIRLELKLNDLSLRTLTTATCETLILSYRSNFVRINDYAMMEYSEFVMNYIRLSHSMDDSNLPADFRSAWRDHMNAWKDYSNFLKTKEERQKAERNCI